MKSSTEQRKSTKFSGKKSRILSEKWTVKTKFLTFILILAKIEMPDSSNTSTAIDLLSKANEVVSEEITSETKEIAPYTRIDLGDVTPHNIKLLKKVNQVVFPIVYHDKFYKDVLGSDYVLLIFSQFSNIISQKTHKKSWGIKLQFLNNKFHQNTNFSKLLKGIQDKSSVA